MKTITLFAFLFLASFSFSQFNGTASDYLAQINNDFKPVQQATWEYIKSYAKNRSAKKIEHKRIELAKSIQKALDKVKQVKPFKSETYLRDSVLLFLEVDLLVINHEFAKIVNMEDISKQSYNEMHAYINIVEATHDKLTAVAKKADGAEARFIAQYSINTNTLPESKISAKLQKASEMYDYFIPMFLVTFKAYIQDAYLINAISSSDLTVIETERNRLLKITKEALLKVEKMDGYLNDFSYKTACLDLLNFYLDEVNQVQKIIDFWEAKTNYNESLLFIRSKRERNLKQKHVDKHKFIVNKYNRAYAENIKAINHLDTERVRLIHEWTKAENSFTSRHVN